MEKKSFPFLFAFIWVCSLASPLRSAQASSWIDGIFGPTGGVSVGMEGATGPGGQVGAYVQLCFDVINLKAIRSSEANVCANPIVGLLRTRAAMSVTTDGERVLVPYVDVDFQMGNLPMNIANGVPPQVDPSLRMHRDVRLNQNFSLRFSVFTYQAFWATNGAIVDNLGSEASNRNKIAAFIRIGADALGMKYLSHMNERGDFVGANLANALVEGGVSFPIHGPVRAQVVLGTSADINMGGVASDAGGFSFQSDVQTYAQIALDVTTLARIFIRGGWNGAWESLDGDTRGSLQGMAGATFQF